MSGKTTEFSSINPSDGSVVWSGTVTSEADVNAAVATARAAFPAWSMQELEKRASILKAFSRLVREETEELATLIAREIGKPLREARQEVGAIAGKVDISIKAHQQRCASFTGGKAVTRFRPHGVLAVIGPYNFPGHLPNGHICPALLAGNTVLFKPSEIAPATGERLVSLWHRAGVPADVLQILQGPAMTARALIGNPDLDGVLFTGSFRTGQMLARQMAESPGKLLALEMGGNNPLIVDPSHLGSPEGTVEVIIKSAFLSAGQRCTCARRLIVVEGDPSPALLDRLVSSVRDLRIDHPFADPEPFMGPLASAGFVEQALQQCATLIEGGAVELLKPRALETGTGFMSPGIYDTTEAASVPDEEIFAPVLQIIRVPDLNTAVTVANATRYGLAAGFLSDAKDDYERIRPRLRAGIINWNCPLTGASSAAPFGGIKDSGNLRPSAFFAADYCSYPVASMEAPAVE